jgi:hypothetical protein
MRGKIGKSWEDFKSKPMKDILKKTKQNKTKPTGICFQKPRRGQKIYSNIQLLWVGRY